MKLRGAWRRDYSEFFDTQEALLIDAMDNADSIYTVFARLQSLAVKCGCAGKLLLHESVPYTDEMLAAVTKKTVPAFRQCMQPLVQLGLVICEDGIYAIADWEFNQNVPAIDAMREGNRVRKASERARRRNRRNAGHQRQGGLYTREERAVQVRPRRQSHSGIQKLLRQLVGTKLTDKEKIRYGSNQAEKNKVFRYLLVCK